ncbi:uncharacterized protein LOC114365796 [Ostrinia furnacalis]|uniref:uncharacterized protein LOC114365796 n=1 Tax=Ostrinia furnacalis TaxID=93504 RepID=UPI00103F6465|nr:uncharacterized protein LOC114365796 [Ostrinia furnacalis]
MRVELGRVPDGIFLKDPTTYGNLFHKYKWPEVQRHLEVHKMELTDIINQNVELRIHEIENNCTDNIKIERALFENVETNVFSTWSAKGMPDEEIFYDVNINYEGSQFKYQNKWRDSSLKSKFVKFGKSVNGNLFLKPGQTFVKKLTATKTIFVLKIDYRARMIGNIIGDYENLYGKYHFWSPTIENIMRAGKIPNEIMTSEKIEIRCFTDPKLEIFDKDTGQAMPLRKKRRLFWKSKPRFTW